MIQIVSYNLIQKYSCKLRRGGPWQPSRARVAMVTLCRYVKGTVVSSHRIRIV